MDKVRIWKGKRLHILVVENQNYVDYQMVLRNMLQRASAIASSGDARNVHTEKSAT